MKKHTYLNLALLASVSISLQTHAMNNFGQQEGSSALSTTPASNMDSFESRKALAQKIMGVDLFARLYRYTYDDSAEKYREYREALREELRKQNPTIGEIYGKGVDVAFFTCTGSYEESFSSEDKQDGKDLIEEAAKFISGQFSLDDLQREVSWVESERNKTLQANPLRLRLLFHNR